MRLSGSLHLYQLIDAIKTFAATEAFQVKQKTPALN